MQPSAVAAGKQLLQREGEKSFSLTKCSQSLLGGFAQVALSFHQGEAAPPFYSLGKWPPKSTSQQTNR